MRQRLLAVVLLLTLAGSIGCAGNKAPVIVGQSALATSASIEVLSTAARQLREAGSLPAAADVQLQTALQTINGKLAEVPDLLRSIERLQAANDPATALVDRVIAILSVVGQDVSVVLAGVPISATTQELITLVRAAQGTVHTALVAVAKLQQGGQ